MSLTRTLQSAETSATHAHPKRVRGSCPAALLRDKLARWQLRQDSPFILWLDTYQAREATNTRSGARGGGRTPGRDRGPTRPRGRVEEGGAYGPSRRQLAGRVATHVRLHGSQAGAANPAQRAAIRSSPMCPQVLGHGREIPGALRTEATGEGLLSYRWRKPEKEEMGEGWPS